MNNYKKLRKICKEAGEADPSSDLCPHAVIEFSETFTPERVGRMLEILWRCQRQGMKAEQIDAIMREMVGDK